MLMDPYRRPKDEINAVWKKNGWPFPTGFYQAFDLPGQWSPYQEFRLEGSDWQVVFCSEAVPLPQFDSTGTMKVSLIEPPSLLIYAIGKGDAPADCIHTARDSVEALAGLLSVVLGKGNPILNKVQSGAYLKDKPEKTTYFPAGTWVTSTAMTKQYAVEALGKFSRKPLKTIPDHINRALRWYGKGISDENPVVKFISLYQSSLAIVGRWHRETHREAYIDECDPTKGRNPPVRRMFGDWVRDVTNPKDAAEETERFQHFRRMVGVRNDVLKGGRLTVEEDDVICAVSCSLQLLNWALSELTPAQP